MRQDADGFSYGVAYGKPATFRQKRDGRDEYIEGFADRLEYDDARTQAADVLRTPSCTKGK